MSANMVEIMNRGMKCLTDQMGIVEAEQFISFIIREKFDYTKWQRGYFDRKTPEEISREASDFEQAHPFSGNAIRLWFWKINFDIVNKELVLSGRIKQWFFPIVFWKTNVWNQIRFLVFSNTVQISQQGSYGSLSSGKQLTGWPAASHRILLRSCNSRPFSLLSKAECFNYK